jgi:hypothetical protein
VPRKTKTAEDRNLSSSKSDGPALAKKTAKRQSGRRAATNKKPRKEASHKERIARTTPQISASPQPEPATSGDFSEETVRLRAYFISERRRRFALPGDAESDWLEAKRQLVAETRR